MSHGCQGHDVQFYTDMQICEAVAAYVEAGLRKGDSIILVITDSHRETITQVLRSRGFDVNGATNDGQIQWLDARKALSKFMVGNTPDADLFKESVGNLVEQAQVDQSKSLRIFGEMVDLLVRDGNTEGAIDLERLWNDHGRTHGFSLLCAYVVGKFYREEHWHEFQLICDQHIQIVGDIDPETDKRPKTSNPSAV